MPIQSKNGLGLKLWSRVLVFLGFTAAAIIIYNGLSRIQLNEIFHIILIEYFSVFLLTGIIAGGLWEAPWISENILHKDRRSSYQAV
jgi:hypothetical protein